MLAVSIAEPASKVRDYMAKHQFTFPAVLDTDSSVSNLYGIRGTPTRYLIDREGKIVAGSIGPRDWDSQEARGLITTLLGSDRKKR